MVARAITKRQFTHCAFSGERIRILNLILGYKVESTIDRESVPYFNESNLRKLPGRTLGNTTIDLHTYEASYVQILVGLLTRKMQTRPFPFMRFHSTVGSANESRI